MVIVDHRINTLEGLDAVPRSHGAEIDIRYHENDLVLQHDPFRHHQYPLPQRLEAFLERWNHEGPLILNVKTEGIELRCIELMRQHNVKQWFFLDLSMPYFVLFAKRAKKGEIEGFSPENLAVRFSEFEPIEYALSFSGQARWVWVDCFTKLPLNEASYRKLKNAGFQICLVAPELQKHPADRALEFQDQLQGLSIDAVCTKRSDLWEK